MSRHGREMRARPFRLPNCCAMPHNAQEGKRYICLTCQNVYMVINGSWTHCDPITDLHEFPESVHDDLHNPHDLDEGERHG